MRTETGSNGIARSLALAAIALPLLLAAAPASSAQSLLDRPPNLGGTWVSDPGVLQFHFLHRFTVGDAPQRKVTNVPTFLLAAGLPGRTTVGFRYATSSQLVLAVPNEWEFFGRINPLARSRGAPADVAVHLGYNQAAESIDGELALARTFGRLRLLAAGRGFSNAFDAGKSRWAVAGGAVIALTPNLAIAGDIATLLDRDEDAEDIAWGAGLQLRIPYTPHTLSLQVTNTNSGSLAGSSYGPRSASTGSDVRYGFEFTIPVTLSRYFGRQATVETGPPVQATGDTVRIVMQSLAYQTTQISIARGTTVIWENRDAVAHTVTADDGRFDSGLIDAGRSWARTFGETGTFTYHCTPHPFMKGTVIVR